MNKIEVAVVVSLITVLGVMMMPAVRHHPSSTLDLCGNKLKHLGLAAAIYGCDNEGDRPGPQPMGIEIPGVSWDRSLAIYRGANLGQAGIYEPLDNLTKILPSTALKTLAIFNCPIDAQAKGGRLIPLIPGSLADGMASGKGICRSYVLNLGIGNPADGIAPTADAVPAKKISSAAGTVYLIESHGYATVFGQRNIANDTTMTCSNTGGMIPQDAFTNPLVPMHGSAINPRVNALMHDGHVEVLDQKEITANGGQIMQYVKEAKAPVDGRYQSTPVDANRHQSTGVD